MASFNGYEFGQLDALDWIARGPRPDDEPLAAFCESAQPLASMLCLAHNLATAAALCRAWTMGAREFGYVGAWDQTWQPGCGRSAP